MNLLIKDVWFTIYNHLDCLSRMNFRLTCKSFSKFKWELCDRVISSSKRILDINTGGMQCIKCRFTLYTSYTNNVKCIIGKKYDLLIFASFWIGGDKIAYTSKDFKIICKDKKIPYYFEQLIPKLKNLLKFERNNTTKFRDYIRLMSFPIFITDNLI